MKKVLRLFLFVLAFAVLMAGLLAIAGGGFDKKDKPPILFNQENEKLLLFAHRGMTDFPENSMEGLQAAEAAGFSAIEIDIRLTADDSAVVFHDEDCHRLLGKDVPVSTLKAQELRERSILLNGKLSASKVVMLEDVFSAFGSRQVIYLDVKLHDTGMAGKMASLISLHHLEKSTLVANSNLFFLGWLEYYHPQINTVLEGFTPGKEWLYSILPVRFRPDFVASFASDVNADHMEWLDENNLTANKIVYGVHGGNFREMVNAGVQKMIVDFDSTMTEELKKLK